VSALIQTHLIPYSPPTSPRGAGEAEETSGVRKMTAGIIYFTKRIMNAKVFWYYSASQTLKGLRA